MSHSPPSEGGARGGWSHDRLSFPNNEPATSLLSKLLSQRDQLFHDLPPIVPEASRLSTTALIDFITSRPPISKDDLISIVSTGHKLAKIGTIIKNLRETKGNMTLVRAKHGGDLRDLQLSSNLPKDMEDRIMEQSKEWHQSFFAQSFDIPPLPPSITQEQVEFWESNKFELLYLPRVRMTEDQTFPGWKKKPNQGINLYNQLNTIQNLEENKNNPNLKDPEDPTKQIHPLDLPGVWILRDTRSKPNYKDNGTQSYEDDALIQGVIAELNLRGITNPESTTHRNKIHPTIFSKPEFWIAMRESLNLPEHATIRLPRVIEQNTLGQGSDWDGTRSWEWAEEMQGSGSRLISGHSAYGGASYVDWFDDASGRVGFRPLVVLSR